MLNFSLQGELSAYLKENNDLDFNDRLGMSMSVVNGMDYLVRQHYIHRDLAARNCLVRPNKSVVISFLSLCEDTHKEDYHMLNGVPVPLRWLSPESMNEEKYTEKSDVWSFGVTVWEIFTGGDRPRPYNAFSDEDVLNGVPLDLRLTKPKVCPEELFYIVSECWDNSPDARPTFSELKKRIGGVNVE